MAKIIEKTKIHDNITQIRLKAPLIATKAKAGQFIILRLNDFGERIPLTIADSDEDSITIVFLHVGKTTNQLASMEVGDLVLDLVGPLGRPTEIAKFGTVALVGGGLGVAPLYPIAKALKKAGNKIICVFGFRNKELVFWEQRFKSLCDEVIICTDDGSYGRKGLVTDALKEKLNCLDRVITVGPPIMMKFVSLTTKDQVPTIASLNSIMVDGTGMCGGCRVIVDGKVRFACVEGPEFDAHLVDWDSLLNRNKAYVEEERCRLEQL